MAVPIMRSYTSTGAALNIFTPSTDDVTGLTIQQLNRSNTILDCVNNPDPPGAAAYQTNVLVNGIQSGVSNFSVASSAASAGRVVFGNIPITVGGQAGGKQLSFQTAQVATGGGIAQYSFLMKYDNLF
jgi:hypothetical protein|tara:strand:+ start:2287 stop:2670 length:384 start_codon:yes stop_codon:yes gene_type:complete